MFYVMCRFRESELHVVQETENELKHPLDRWLADPRNGLVKPYKAIRWDADLRVMGVLQRLKRSWSELNARADAVVPTIVMFAVRLSHGIGVAGSTPQWLVFVEAHHSLWYGARTSPSLVQVAVPWTSQCFCTAGILAVLQASCGRGTLLCSPFLLIVSGFGSQETYWMTQTQLCSASVVQRIGLLARTCACQGVGGRGGGEWGCVGVLCVCVHASMGARLKSNMKS